MSKFIRDAAERVVATVLQAAIAVVAVEIAKPEVTNSRWALLVPLAAGVLAAAKAWVAKHLGDPESASLVS